MIDQKQINITNIRAVPIIEIIPVLFFIILTTIFYFYFDSKSIFLSGNFIWDSIHYRFLAEELHSNSSFPLEVLPPFGYRILYPWIFGFIHEVTGFSYIHSSFVLNIVSSWILLLLSYILWRREKCNKTLSWIGVVYFSVFWLGPIRQTIANPGSSFAFDALLTIVLFFVLSRSKKNSIASIIASTVLVFILAIGREFITYILFITTALYFISKLNRNIFGIGSVLIKFQKMIMPIDKLSLVLACISSLFAYVFVRSIIQSPISSAYSAIETIAFYGWFHLHFVEFFYPLFYALGSLIIIIFAIISLKKTRIEFLEHLSRSTIFSGLSLYFCFFGVIFGLFGGTDSDRFILWFFPFYALFSIKAIEVLIKNKVKNRPFYALFFILIISTLLGSRLYTKAVPNIFFPGKGYNSFSGIKTDYNPDLFYGPTFMEKYRLPLINVSLDNELHEGTNIKAYSTKSIPKVPYLVDTKLRNGSWYKGQYMFEINNIPFPLGFSHNQYETFVAHPFYGWKVVKIILLIQWFFVLLLVIFFMKKLVSMHK